MPDLLTTGSTLMCPHGGTITAITSNARAKAVGAFILRASDTFTIAGCGLVLGTVPHPCVSVQWVQPASRGKVLDEFVLTQASVGLCTAADQAAQGAVLVSVTQDRVSGL